ADGALDSPETSQELAWQPTNSTGRKFSRARAGARGLAGLACSTGRRHGRVVARAPGRCGSGRELGARRIVRGGGGWQTQNGGAHRAPSRKRSCGSRLSLCPAEPKSRLTTLPLEYRRAQSPWLTACISRNIAWCRDAASSSFLLS